MVLVGTAATTEGLAVTILDWLIIILIVLGIVYLIRRI